MNGISQMLKDANREVNQVKTETVNTESNTSVYTKSNTDVLTKFKPKVKDKTVIISLRITKKRLDKVDKLASKYSTTRQAIIDTMIDNL